MKHDTKAKLISGGMMAAVLLLASIPATAKPATDPQNILPAPTAAPSAAASPAAAPVPAASPTTPATASPTPPPMPVPVPVPVPDPVMSWSPPDARALLATINTIADDGLVPADYQPEQLRAAIASGPGPALDAAASKSFVWLAEDLRDGRTPMAARVQWFAVDPDVDANPTPALMARALDAHDIAGVLNGLAPTYPDYQVLKTALAATPRSEARKRASIQANMDRWRWLPRNLGLLYLLTNVPEFQMRLATNDRIVRTYRTIVGRPGKTATPQLAEKVEAVVFNPTWTVPQSIVVGEGMGARLLAHPNPQYKVSRAANGVITVVQQPGPSNSLGVMKIDMPNPHAIYLHDTPNHALFNLPVRALSHGCVRTERAQELGMTMAMLGADLTPELATHYALSGKYTKVAMTRTFPVYIGYFTIAQDITGKLTSFNDIYGRDAPVLASFNQPRALKTGQRTSTEAIIKLDNPL